LCAHHERLFCRSFKIAPKLFKDSKGINNGSIFGTLLVLGHMYRAMWPENWVSLCDLASELERDIGLDHLTECYGFASNWKEKLEMPT